MEETRMQKSYLVIGNIGGSARMLAANFDPSRPLQPQLEEFAIGNLFDLDPTSPGVACIPLAASVGLKSF